MILRVIGAVLMILTVCHPASAAELLVSAAASLTNAFQEIGGQFEGSHSGTKVTFNFAASNVLVKQIIQGAPVDVFASADQESMDRAVQENVIDRATRFNFAANRLVLVVPNDSKIVLKSIHDLKTKEVARIAVGQPATVPAGRYAKRALDEARLWEGLQGKFIYTQNVRQNLDYVARGEVDAGFVYSTDAAIVKDKVKVAFEVPTPEPVLYPIAITRASRTPQFARQFLDFVKSEVGQKILQRFGFTKP
jgi:molybdate transport system substrate-binding protein